MRARPTHRQMAYTGDGRDPVAAACGPVLEVPIGGSIALSSNAQ